MGNGRTRMLALAANVQTEDHEAALPPDWMVCW